MRLVRIACILALLLVLVACGKRREEVAPIVAKPAVAQTHGCELRAEVVPETPRVSLGQAAYVTFRVTTACAEPLKVLAVADAGNAIGRPNSYRLSAVDAKGNEVQAIDVTNDQGGADGLIDFGPGKPFETRLAVAQWLAFPKPGRYELTVRKDFPVGKARPDLDWVPLKVSTPVEVTP